MKPLTPSQKDNVLSLLHTGASTREISAHTGVSKSRIASLAKEALPDKESHPAGRPKKLSTTDEYAVIQQISTGRAKNAAQVAKNINPLLPHPVSTQTIQIPFTRPLYSLAKSRKSPSSFLVIGKLVWHLLRSIWNGP